MVTTFWGGFKRLAVPLVSFRPDPKLAYFSAVGWFHLPDDHLTVVFGSLVVFVGWMFAHDEIRRGNRSLQVRKLIFLGYLFEPNIFLVFWFIYFFVLSDDLNVLEVYVRGYVIYQALFHLLGRFRGDVLDYPPGPHCIRSSG
jgi:hypothetical protein